MTCVVHALQLFVSEGELLFFAFNVAAFRVFNQAGRVSGDPFIVKAPFEERLQLPCDGPQSPD